MPRPEHPLTRPPIVAALALLCCALWGSAFPCVKVGYQMLSIERTGSQLLFAGCRFFLAGLLALLLGGLAERRMLRIPRSAVPAVIGQGLLQTTAQYVCFYISLAHISGSRGSVLNATSAFFAILFAPLLLRGERITMRTALGCLIGFAGVLVLNLAPGGQGGFTWLGDGLMLLCAAIYGASSVTLKRISGCASPAAITAWQLLAGSAVLIVLGLLAGGQLSGFTPASATLLGYMALLSAAAFSIWAALLKHNPVGKISVYGFCIPVFGVLFSAIFLHEQFVSLKNLLALLLVSAGVCLVNTGTHRT